ncbi:MAG TPA: flagellar basal body rod protein FlgB [Rickettsiales bacterium]|nr:flagellar basal body rod protein FlgB [Rickettsiales bacterium]
MAALNLTDMVQVKMHYDAERQKVLAQNIASKGIPGYKAQDLVPLDFSNVLKSQTSKVNLATTSAMHLAGGTSYTPKFLTVTESNPFDMTSTGNTVVTEEQMMKVAQNSLDYQMSTNLYKKINNLFKEALGLQPSA